MTISWRIPCFTMNTHTTYKNRESGARGIEGNRDQVSVARDLITGPSLTRARTDASVFYFRFGRYSWRNGIRWKSNYESISHNHGNKREGKLALVTIEPFFHLLDVLVA